jgi:hypothetical protein
MTKYIVVYRLEDGSHLFLVDWARWSENRAHAHRWFDCNQAAHVARQWGGGRAFRVYTVKRWVTGGPHTLAWPQYREQRFD